MKVVCDITEPAFVTMGFPLASLNVISRIVDKITVGINGITAVSSGCAVGGVPGELEESAGAKVW